MAKTAESILRARAASAGSARAPEKTSTTASTATSTTASTALTASLGSWPAVLMVLLVFGAALFAFSPRPLPSFPATQIGADQLLIDGLARRGARLLAVGEQGKILIADDARGPWRAAKVEPQRGSTLTQVLFVDDQLALAVGHDSWIVRSTDGGQSWREVNFNAELSEPLLGIAGPYNGKIYAFGGFSQMLVSSDLGKTWQPQTLDTATPATAALTPAANKDPNADPFGSDPFGAGATADSGSDRHLNGMVQLGDGSLLLVGEKGLLMKSGDNGASWKMLPSIYKGSFFGALRLPSNAVLVYGMRGHVFLSRDDGKTWSASATPGSISLFGGSVTADGDIYLVGDSNTVLVSHDGGAHFGLAANAEPKAGVGARGGLAAVLPVGGDMLLTAGENGVGVQKMAADETASRNGAGR